VKLAACSHEDAEVGDGSPSFMCPPMVDAAGPTAEEKAANKGVATLSSAPAGGGDGGAKPWLKGEATRGSGRSSITTVIPAPTCQVAGLLRVVHREGKGAGAPDGGWRRGG